MAPFLVLKSYRESRKQEQLTFGTDEIARNMRPLGFLGSSQ